MPTFEQALNEYGKAIEKEKPFPALLGAYINGAFRIVVPTNPALAYVRHLDNTPATAYHHNNVDLTLDVTVAANQNKSISLYYDEYDHLAIWGLAPPEAGANLQADPNAGAGGVKAVVAGTNVTVDNTDPTRPIINASVTSAVVGTVLWDKTLSGAGTFDTNSADDHGNSGLFATSYLWLELLYDVRGAKAATGVSLRIALNNDSTDSNYQAVTAFQGSSGGGALNDNNRVVTEAPGDSATANYFAQGRATIYNPGSTHFKSVTTFGSDPRSTSDHHVDENSVLWRDTSAISRIALDVSDGTTTTFVTGSRLTVIGYS